MKKNPQISNIEYQISVPRTVYIVGPTASGKSALAMDVAGYLKHAEIVCADSQTVRKYMDIGTAKPSAHDRAIVPHHCLDLVDPYEPFTLHEYLLHARDAIAQVHARGNVAIVVGGSGLYVDALYFDFSLPETVDDRDSARVRYEGMAVEELQEEIERIGLSMPENERNKRHLVNVLLRQGNRGRATLPDPASCIVGIAPQRDEHWQRLVERTEAMFASGFVDEVRAIVAKFGRPPHSFDAIAYKIVMQLIDGDITEQQAKSLIHIAERQYAKRQMTWFKRNKNIQWFTEVDSAREHLYTICRA